MMQDAGSTGRRPVRGASSSDERVNSSARIGEQELRQVPEEDGLNWAGQLLNLCATAIASNNLARTKHLMSVLNDLGSLTGDANQRLAAYGLKSLYCRVTCRKDSAVASYLGPLRLQVRRLGPKTVHRALIKFHELSPWHQLIHTVSNQTLLQVFEGHTHLHVIDIGVSQGLQWPSLIDSLVSRDSGPPALLRITTMKEHRPHCVEPAAGGEESDPSFEDNLNRLVKFAGLLGLNVELSILTEPLESVTRQQLQLREGEVLAICAQFRLHRIIEDERDAGFISAPSHTSHHATSRLRHELSPRDGFLNFLFQLQPHVLILGENDIDHLSHDFLTRFKSVMSLWWKFFDSLHIAFQGQDVDERQILEDEVGRMMLNNVACEGAMRIERCEPQISWARRLQMASFEPLNLTAETLEAVCLLLHKSGAHWGIAVAANCVTLLWKQQATTFCSVWKPHTSQQHGDASMLLICSQAQSAPPMFSLPF